MRSARSRRSTVLTVVSAMLLSVSGLALADELKLDEGAVDLSLSVGASSRTLQVTDFVTDEELTEMTLQPGKASPMRVKVVDNSYEGVDVAGVLLPRGFTVWSSMTNLYLDTGGAPEWDARIDSERVNLSYVAGVPAVSDVAADVLANLTVSGTINCSAFNSLGLSLSLLNALRDLGCNLLAGLLSGTINLSNVPVAGELPIGLELDLAELALAALPLVPDVGDSDDYEHADYANGIGAAHADAVPGDVADLPSATRLRVLTATSNADALTGAVRDALVALNLPLVSATGEDALLSVGELLNGLGEHSSSLASALGSLTNPLSALTGLTSNLGAPDIRSLTGTYGSLPQLRVDATGIPAGTYTGTLTLTLVE